MRESRIVESEATAAANICQAGGSRVHVNRQSQSDEERTRYRQDVA